MSPQEKPPWRAIIRTVALASAAVVLAVLLRLFVLTPFIGHQAPFLTFFLAIAAVAWIGGLWPGLLTILFSLVTIWAAGFIPDAFTPLQQLVFLLSFTVVSTLVAAMCESLHRSRRRAATATKALEESQRKLRESEATFRALADSLPVMVWIADPSKACTWFSRQWLDFTGRPLEQELGHEWTERVHPDDRERCLRIYHAAFDRREPFEIDYRLQRHDGEYRWLFDSARPTFAEDGAFRGYMGGCIDIHERKESERRFEIVLHAEQAARAEAERIGLLKDEFLATVSHELRTPLTAILGWTQLLRNRSAGVNATQALEIIERNARAQVRIIEDLLDMNRVLSGRLRLDVQAVDPLQVVEAALAAVEPSAAAKRIRLVREIDLEPTALSADPIRLQQVIWNLLSNAVKFTPAGGRVTLGVRRPDEHLEITVTDTGEGIAPEFLPHVFDRFRQADATSTRRHQGMGLGLSIVKQLVELHGGTVHADSHGVGYGSTFRLRLPLTVAPPLPVPSPDDHDLPAEPADPAASPPSLAGVDTLVVDDEADARSLLRVILEQSGASVRVAASAAEAMTRLQERPPTVLISDIGMPGEDGYQLLRRIRALPNEATRSVPALALTAFARSYDRRRALDAGFHMHLAKPIEPPELIAAVARLARR